MTINDISKSQTEITEMGLNEEYEFKLIKTDGTEGGATSDPVLQEDGTKLVTMYAGLRRKKAHELKHGYQLMNGKDLTNPAYEAEAYRREYSYSSEKSRMKWKGDKDVQFNSFQLITTESYIETMINLRNSGRMQQDSWDLTKPILQFYFNSIKIKPLPPVVK